MKMSLLPLFRRLFEGYLPPECIVIHVYGYREDVFDFVHFARFNDKITLLQVATVFILVLKSRHV